MNAAATLAAMGYRLGADFCAVQEAASVRIEWLSTRPMPTQAEIDAAAVKLERDQTIATLSAAVQSWLDSTAQSFGYDDIRSAISYRGDTVDIWSRQAQAFFVWRSVVWTACIAIQSDVLAGRRAAPKADALIADLPKPAIPTQ